MVGVRSCMASAITGTVEELAVGVCFEVKAKKQKNKIKRFDY